MEELFFELIGFYLETNQVLCTVACVFSMENIENFLTNGLYWLAYFHPVIDAVENFHLTIKTCLCLYNFQQANMMTTE